VNPLGVIPSPQLLVRALDDLHRIAAMSDRLADLGELNRNLADLTKRMAALERQLQNVSGFNKDLDRLGTAAEELTRTMVLLRKTTENVTLNLPGARIVARRASRRREDLRGEREPPGGGG
jgi:hypothetical protein